MNHEYPVNENKLNERNDKTKKVIHLLTTTLCNRSCPYCCNKQYDLNSIPYATDEELREAEIICITGGEPVLYSNPSLIAKALKTRYKNIKNVYVYANALELYEYFMTSNFYSKVDCIDGFTVSIKNKSDENAFESMKDTLDDLKFVTKSNILYLFEGCSMPKYLGNFKVIRREWQEDFKPADDSIFRKI